MRSQGGYRFGLAVAALGVASVASLAVPSPAYSVPFLPPTASLTASPNPALVGETVNFDGSGSTPDTGPPLGSPITTYEWDLDGDSGTGPGGFEVNTGSTPTTSRSYADPGTITVRLRVTDSEGDTDVDSRNLKIHRPPVAGFIFEPSTPAVGDPVTFSSTSTDPDGPIAAYAWDFDGDGFDDGTGETETHSFSTAGNYPVSLRVTDSDGATAEVTRNVLVQESPPNASFVYSPGSPLTLETVSFDGSGSTPPSGGPTITSLTWDLDGDGGFDDASGATATSSYSTPGPHTVGLRVDASDGSFDIETRVVEVGNRAPIASFNRSPQSARAGNTLDLTSTSFDPDGAIASHDWDLDGDGEFDDQTGPAAQRQFPEQGTFYVGLRVVDTHGAAHAVVEEITVGPPAPRVLSPFPIVRLAGQLTPAGNTQIDRLSIRAPEGSDALVRCRGGACPFHEQARTVEGGRARFPQIEQVLPPGVVIKVFVTQPDTIGKFTRFRLRDGKVPKRKDACVEAGSRKPIDCPET
jgi:PKD repeat protein